MSPSYVKVRVRPERDPNPVTVPTPARTSVGTLTVGSDNKTLGFTFVRTFGPSSSLGIRQDPLLRLRDGGTPSSAALPVPAQSVQGGRPQPQRAGCKRETYTIQEGPALPDLPRAFLLHPCSALSAHGSLRSSCLFSRPPSAPPAPSRPSPSLRSGPDLASSPRATTPTGVSPRPRAEGRRPVLRSGSRAPLTSVQREGARAARVTPRPKPFQRPSASRLGGGRKYYYSYLSASVGPRDAPRRGRSPRTRRPAGDGGALERTRGGLSPLPFPAKASLDPTPPSRRRSGRSRLVGRGRTTERVRGKRGVQEPHRDHNEVQSVLLDPRAPRAAASRTHRPRGAPADVEVSGGPAGRTELEA